jgi:hypothetical protein
MVFLVVHQKMLGRGDDAVRLDASNRGSDHRGTEKGILAAHVLKIAAAAWRSRHVEPGACADKTRRDAKGGR